MEELVARDSFGSLLVRATENVMAMTQIANGAIDLVVRNLRLAGRPDLTRLARQISRTEDKLELVLQEVERLSAQVEALRSDGQAENGSDAPAPNGGTSSTRRREAST
jgi:hypothetical protein